MHRFRSS